MGEREEGVNNPAPGTDPRESSREGREREGRGRRREEGEKERRGV